MESPYKLRIRELYWNCTTWRLIRRYRAQLSEVEDDGEKEEQWLRVERERVALKEDKVPVTCGKKKASVRKETNAVSGMRVPMVRKKLQPKAATPSEPSVSRGRSVSRKRSIRGKSNHGATPRQPC